PEEPPVLPRRAEGVAWRAPRRGHLCRVTVRAPARDHRAERGAEAVLLDIPGPRPGDERSADRGRRQSVLPAVARHQPRGSDGAAPAAAAAVPAIHLDPGARNQWQV